MEKETIIKAKLLKIENARILVMLMPDDSIAIHTKKLIGKDERERYERSGFFVDGDRFLFAFKQLKLRKNSFFKIVDAVKEMTG